MTARGSIWFVALTALALVLATCTERRPAQPTRSFSNDDPSRAKASPKKPKHNSHEHSHGSHPHKRDAHHHHPHPHPHVEAPNGHHHPF